jgi:D-inositol-3-phosphate glycosyltransferase
VPVVGGPSGSGLDHPESLALLSDRLGIADVVRFVPPVAQATLAEWYAAADLVAVPSYNESFGLVAVEAQASGTPVVAAAVGGLTTVVENGRSGVLVDTHRAEDWADALANLVHDRALRETLARGAVEQARRFSWDVTAEQTLATYERARSLMREAVA